MKYHGSEKGGVMYFFSPSKKGQPAIRINQSHPKERPWEPSKSCLLGGLDTDRMNEAWLHEKQFGARYKTSLGLKLFKHPKELFLGSSHGCWDDCRR